MDDQAQIDGASISHQGNDQKQEEGAEALSRLAGHANASTLFRNNKLDQDQYRVVTNNSGVRTIEFAHTTDQQSSTNTLSK